MRGRPAYFVPVLLALLLVFGFATRPRRSDVEPRRGVIVPAVIDVGRIDAASLRSVRVPWQRVGSGRLRVLDVQTDCGCALTAPLAKHLDPNESGVLSIHLRVGSRAGPFSVRVRIVTDGDPPLDVATCRVRGFVGRPLAATPAALLLGRLSPGAALTRTVELRRHGGGSDPVVHTQLRGIEGNVAVAPSAFRHRPGAVLTIQLHVPAQRGPFRAHLIVEVADLGELLIPITGEVVGAGR